MADPILPSHLPIIRWVLMPAMATLAGAGAGGSMFCFEDGWLPWEGLAAGIGFGLGAGLASAIAPTFKARFLLAPVTSALSLASSLSVAVVLVGGGSQTASGMLALFLKDSVWVLVVLPSFALVTAQAWIEAVEARWRASVAAVVGGAALLAAVGALSSGISGRDIAPMSFFYAVLGGSQVLGIWAVLKLSRVLRKGEAQDLRVRS